MLEPFAMRDGRLVTARASLDAVAFTNLFVEVVEEQLAIPEKDS
jgi:hypothetical protein